MNCRWQPLGLSLFSLLAILPATGQCQSKATPLQLRLATTSVNPTATPLMTPRHAELRAHAELPSGAKRPHVFHEARPTLSQRALQSLLQNASEEEPTVSDQSGETFRFERQGNAGRNISQGYKHMCA